MQIRDTLSVDSKAEIRAQIRANLVRSASEFNYKNPKVDHNYHIKGTIIVKKN